MRILYVNRDPSLWVGGDAIQVEKTMSAVSKYHDVFFSSNPHVDPRDYDIVHAFNVNFFWTTPMIWDCQLKKVPYVVSPIYFDSEYDNTFGIMSKILTRASRVFPLSNAESEQIKNRMQINGSNFVIVPNGVDKSVFKNKQLARKNRVISVGRLSDPMKGAHLLAEACQDLNIPLLYVGMSADTPYANKVKSMCQHIERVDQKELSKLYNESRVYVCSSLSERQSLGVLEAASCGCPIVDSVHNLGSDFLPSSIIVDPNDIKALKSAIQKQWLAPRNSDNVLSWDDVAKLLVKEYEDIING